LFERLFADIMLAERHVLFRLMLRDEASSAWVCELSIVKLSPVSCWRFLASTSWRTMLNYYSIVVCPANSCTEGIGVLTPLGTWYGNMASMLIFSGRSPLAVKIGLSDR